MADTVVELRAENARLQNQVLELQQRLDELGGAAGAGSDGQGKLDAGGGDNWRKLENASDGQVSEREVQGNPVACKGGRYSFDMSHTLSPEMVRRYSRQVLVTSFGVRGQEKLANSSVLVIGAGGLGSPVALYLAAAGFGRLGIVDRDLVELNNLHRQVIHTEAAVGHSKVSSAANACRAINSSIDVREHPDGLDASNAVNVISQYDVIVDATDNLPSRYIINDACVISGKPLVSGAALGLDGQLTVYNHDSGPCYRCLFPAPPPQAACQRCSDSGVLGVVPGIIGCLQSLEAIKVASGLGKPLTSRLLIFDAESSRMQTVRLRGKDPNCVACGVSSQLSQHTMGSLDYELFTQSPLSDAAPVRIQRLPPALGVSCREYKHRRDAGECHLLLDVRNRNEFSIVSLPNSLNVPFSDLGKHKDLVRSAIAGLQETLGHAGGQQQQSPENGDCQEDAHVPVYVICRRGNDSQEAVQLLRSEGICPAFDVVGGFSSWAKDVDQDFPTY